MKNKKIAIVYDWIDKWGGVERILIKLHELFPHADFFTSYTDFEKARWAKHFPITTTFIQKLPRFIKKRRILSVPFYPYAFESLNFSSYDCVITVSSSFSKGIITNPDTKHILYLLTPSRFLWTSEEEYLSNPLMRKSAEGFKKWDFISAQRADVIFSISKTVQKRCLDYYKRKSEVIYPPFDVEYWSSVKSKTNPQFQILNTKYYLVVSRLEPYKKIGLVVEAFNKKKEPLVIVGTGSLERKLKRRAEKNILFLKNLTDSELAWLYSHAQALVAPQEEDFGYIFLESQFFGLPVVAYNKGGSIEILEENKTAVFFEKQDVESVIRALERYERISYNLKQSARILGRKNVVEYDKKRFKERFLQIVTV